MENIITYLKSRGSEPFESHPFNEVDNLVICYLVYYDLEGIVPKPKEHRRVTVEEAGRAYLKKHGTSQSNVNSEVIRQMIHSPRFARAELTDYVDVFRKGSAQFTALRVIFPEGIEYLTFRGSDNSLTSWQESFAISYCETPSQKMAAEWLGRIYPEGTMGDGELYIGGHSKGGNTALYAAAACRKEIRDRISRIYLNDSPGLTPGLFDVKVLAELSGRIIRIAPEYSLIGQLFHEGTPETIVSGGTEGINQHEPLYWQVEDDHFMKADRHSPRGLYLADVINRWVSSASLSQRQSFTRDFFRSLRKWRAEGGTSVPAATSEVNRNIGKAGSAGTAPDSAFADLTAGSMLRFLYAFLLGASGAARLTGAKLVLSAIRTGLPELLNRTPRT